MSSPDQLTLDYQIVHETCNHCQRAFKVTRGSIYEQGEGIAIYLAALHNCRSGKIVELAIAIREGYRACQETAAIMLKVKPTERDFEMSVGDIKDSFWQTESYLGRMMDRQEALASPLIESFFHIADHIVMEIPEVNRYLTSRAPERGKDGS